MKFDIEYILNSTVDTGNMKWNSDGEYLDRQFKLLREDFSKPLRKDLKFLLEGKTQFDNLIKYENVSVISRSVENKIIHKIAFNNIKDRIRHWGNSRLTLGSLIFMIDSYKNITFGCVAERKVEDLQTGMIGIELLGNESISSNTVYDMFEYTVKQTNKQFTMRHINIL